MASRKAKRSGLHVCCVMKRASVSHCYWYIMLLHRAVPCEISGTGQASAALLMDIGWINANRRCTHYVARMRRPLRAAGACWAVRQECCGRLRLMRTGRWPCRYACSASLHLAVQGLKSAMKGSQPAWQPAVLTQHVKEGLAYLGRLCT